MNGMTNSYESRVIFIIIVNSTGTVHASCNASMKD